MLSSIIAWRLKAEERRFGPGTMAYVRTLWDTTRPGFWAFASARRFLGFRGRLDRDAYHVARIVTTCGEDCGTCVQIAVRLALADGVSPELLGSLIPGGRGSLPASLRPIAEYAAAVLRADDLRVTALIPEIERTFGPHAIGELAIAIAGARVFPTMKRAMGLAVSCAKVEITLPP